MLLGFPFISLEESERRHEGKRFHAFDSQKYFRMNQAGLYARSALTPG
jgi:hypothetical protein